MGLACIIGEKLSSSSTEMMRFGVAACGGRALALRAEPRRLQKRRASRPCRAAIADAGRADALCLRTLFAAQERPESSLCRYLVLTRRQT